MPRITHTTYLDRHKLLRTAWLKAHIVYGVLSWRQQLDLHTYYQPAKKSETSELLRHRRRITRKRPTLAAAAGIYFHRIQRVLGFAKTFMKKDKQALGHITAEVAQQLGQVKVSPHAGNSQRVRVIGIARPEIDFKLLAQACVMLARDLSTEEIASEAA